MKLLVTGGTGFFGRALLRYYLSNSAPTELTKRSIVVLSRDPERFQASFPEFTAGDMLSFHKGNIQDRASLPWHQSFSHVLHAATDSTFGPRLSPLQRFKQIVEGTNNILDLAIDTGASRFLLTSSGAVYGPQPPDLAAIPEDWLGSPPLGDSNSSYSHAKRTAEHLCALYQNTYGIETVVARCFAFVGPDLPLDVHFAIGNFIHDALHAPAITVAGDGSPLRTYLYQSDLAHWLWTLLLKGRAGEAYNVGSDEVVSIAELAHLVRDLLAPEKSIQILGDSRLSLNRHSYVPCIRKSGSISNLKVTVPLKSAVLSTARAHQRQEDIVSFSKSDAKENPTSLP